MSEVRILPSRLCGQIRIPVSKSAAHRAVICAALAGGDDPLPAGEALSEDLAATRGGVAVLLAACESTALQTGPVHIDCGESGSTLRFLVPLAAALGVPAVFTGRGRLPQRPVGVYLDCLPRHGATCETAGGRSPAGGLPLTIRGKLAPGRFELPGGVSSQFVTGLLLALPLLPGDSEIVLTSPLESAPYVEMTTEIMRAYGVSVSRTEAGWKPASGWRVGGGQAYRPNPSYRVERDWSQAAFFLAAGMLGGDVELGGMNPSSAQGDRACVEIFRRMGARIEWENGLLRAAVGPDSGSRRPAGGPDEGQEPIRIDASQIPDLVPVLAAAAALLPGRTTVISRAHRLRLKESDRLAAMAEGLGALGGDVRQTPDGLVIRGVERLRGGTAEGHNDHRVVMALAVAALRAEGETVLTDAQSVRKSYPDFFRDYNRLGGKAYDVGE